MAQDWQAFPSAIPSNGYNAVNRTFVDRDESVGDPDSAAAAAISATNSLFSMAKGIGEMVGVPVGTGDAEIDDHPHLMFDPARTLGEPSDAPASDLEYTSAISLSKAFLQLAGL